MSNKKLDLKNKHILVTGGAGFLGTFVVKELIKKGAHPKNIFVPRSKELDLKKYKNCQKVVENKDIIIHLAAKVGGIGLNKEKPGELFYDNLIMGAQLMEAARQTGIKKFVAVGTVCAYPKFTSVPFKEQNLWLGYPEENNAPYGLAKKMLLVQSQAYRQQYGFNSMYLLPVNLYGPGDNFNPDRSHVIPALIKKIGEAKREQQPFVEIWGTGNASREFLYVEDAAKAIVFATEKYEKPEPVNIGSGMEIKIKSLAKLICRFMRYEGKIKWAPSKPDGQPRRMLDVSLAKKEFGLEAATDFQTGLRKTINWYIRFQKA